MTATYRLGSQDLGKGKCDVFCEVVVWALSLAVEWEVCGGRMHQTGRLSTHYGVALGDSQHDVHKWETTKYRDVGYRGIAARFRQILPLKVGL